MKNLTNLRIMQFDCLGEIQTKGLFLYMYVSPDTSTKKNIVKHKTAFLIHFTCISTTFKTSYNLLCGVRQVKTHNFIVSEGTGQ